MRIALDATPLAGAPGGKQVGGIARYTAQLVGALAREFPSDEFILLSDQPFELPCDAPNLRAGRGPKNILERRWWTCGLQRELKRQEADIFHGADFAVPFPATMPAVMTLHDMSPWINAPWVDDDWRERTARVHSRVPWLIRTGAASHIITPSEAIRREAIRFFQVDPQRVTAIPLAAAPHFRPKTPAGARPPYFLFVGMLEPRKDIARLLAAWEILRTRCPVDLVLAGPQRPNHPSIPHRPGLRLRGVVSESDLAELYCGAIALVYPSLYEGFGLPVLEAMQCGTPVIISADPALCETAGDAGLQEQTPEGIAQAMQRLFDDPAFRAEMQARSLARAAQFTWERTARATCNVYRSMLAS